jgi:hypothetical protein
MKEKAEENGNKKIKEERIKEYCKKISKKTVPYK